MDGCIPWLYHREEGRRINALSLLSSFPTLLADKKGRDSTNVIHISQALGERARWMSIENGLAGANENIQQIEKPYKWNLNGQEVGGTSTSKASWGTPDRRVRDGKKLPISSRSFKEPRLENCWRTARFCQNWSNIKLSEKESVVASLNIWKENRQKNPGYHQQKNRSLPLHYKRE